MKKIVDLIDVSGGICWVAYPVAGCASFAAANYVTNPDVSGYDLGRSCAKGAIHSLNPGFGLVGGVVAHPLARYVGGVAYSTAVGSGVDYVAPPRKNQNTFSAEHFMMVGYNE